MCEARSRWKQDGSEMEIWKDGSKERNETK
jgi:hypothetical protein